MENKKLKGNNIDNKYGIEYMIMFTKETLNKHLKEIQEIAEARIDIIIEQLKKQNNLIEEYKIKRDECTTILNKYRKNLKIANWILEDTPKIKEVIKIEQQMKIEQEDITKTRKKERYVGR